MSRRPLSITVIGWVLVCVGLVSFVTSTWRYFSSGGHADAPPASSGELLDLGVAAASAIAATAGGAFVPRGANWARWLLAAWLAFHVVISALHPLDELVIHGLLFGVVGCFLFRPAASAYFHGGKPPLAGAPPS